MRFLTLLLTAMLLLAGCAESSTVPGKLADELEPSAAQSVSAGNAPVEEPPPIQVSRYTHTADYYASDSGWIASLSILSPYSYFEQHGYTNSAANPYLVTFTVPFDWENSEFAAKSPDSKIRVSKDVMILHIPADSWPPNLTRLADVVGDLGGEVTETDGVIGVQLGKKYWYYYVPLDEDTLARVEITDDTGARDLDLHLTLANSVTLVPTTLRLLDMNGVQVLQYDRDTLEIVTSDRSFTVTGHPTDDCYEAWFADEGRLMITVFRREEQYLLLVDTTSGEITEVHAPSTVEALAAAGFDTGDAQVLSQYRYFDRYSNTSVCSMHLLTTTEGEYSVYVENGEVTSAAASPFEFPIPDHDSILRSFAAMRNSLCTYGEHAVEHNEVECIGGEYYYYSYRLSRDYDAFAYALGQRLTTACAERILDGVSYRRAQDGRLLHRGNHAVSRLNLDITLAEITHEPDGAFLMKLPERGPDNLIVGWHAFRYVYEDSAWRWDFDKDTAIS